MAARKLDNYREGIGIELQLEMKGCGAERRGREAGLCLDRMSMLKCRLCPGTVLPIISSSVNTQMKALRLIITAIAVVARKESNAVVAGNEERDCGAAPTPAEEVK